MTIDFAAAKLSFGAIYIRHDNDDQVIATIGRQVIGKHFDSSFFKP